MFKGDNSGIQGFSSIETMLIICFTGVLVSFSASHVKHFTNCLSDVLKSSDWLSGQPNGDIFTTNLANCARFNSIGQP